MKYICDYCKKEFDVKISQYNKKIRGIIKTISCSKECCLKLYSKRFKGGKSPKYIPRLEKECLNCSRIFKVEKKLYEKQMFCNRKCVQEYKVKKSIVIINCLFCNKEITTQQGKINKGQKFCSNNCSRNHCKKRVTKTCVICNNDYETHNRRSGKSKTCSKECSYKWLSIYSNQEDVRQRLKKQGVKTCMQQTKSMTAPEKIVLDYLNNNNIENIPQYVINNTLIADFFLPKYNCILEVYGDYWHSNPKIYGDKENLKPLNEMQRRNKNRDIRRYKVITKKLNYRFYSLWEADIYENINTHMNIFLKYINAKIRND